MSASSKKKLRKEQEAVKMTDQQLTAQKEAKKLNLYTTIFVITLAVLLVVAISVGVYKGIANSGIREKKTTALVVNDHEISNAELNYFYIDAVNQFANQYGSYAVLFGLDTTKPLDQQYLDEENGLTWADDFMNTAKENAKAIYAMVDAAEAAGFALSEEDQAALEKNVSDMDLYAKLNGFSSVNDYLKALYGRGADKEGFLAFAKNAALANAYMADYTASLRYEDADLRAVDSENFGAYSSYTFRTYSMGVNAFQEGGTEDEDGKITYSDDEKAAALAACEAAAKSLVAEEIDSVEAFNEAIASLPINAEVEASSTLTEGLLYTSLNKAYAEWISDSSRRAGDKAYFPNVTTSQDADGNTVETVNGYYVVYFLEANDNTFDLVNVRHILSAFQGGTKDEATGTTVYSDSEKSAAKAAAKELLLKWESTDPSEKSFAALANEESDDGDGTTGGLYENVFPGQMVQPFNDWCFDESRKPGDTGIVETQYGYHVMYFSGNSDVTYRDYMIERDLRSADSKEWYDGIVASAAVTEGSTRYIVTSQVLSRK